MSGGVTVQDKVDQVDQAALPALQFTVIIPARLASTRLPGKPLADIHGKPMVVRVAEQAQRSGAAQVVVATDADSVLQACAAHGVQAMLTRADHPSGTDRIAEVAARLALPPQAVVVNVQGDEPLIDPALIAACARLIGASVPMATCAHPLHEVAEIFNPNVVKVVVNRAGHALYFSRAAIPWHRDAFAASAPGGAGRGALPTELPTALPTALPPHFQPLRHIGLYAFRNDFLQLYPTLAPAPLEHIEALEQLRVLWHGHALAVHETAHATAPGVDTPADLERVRQIFNA